MLSLMKSLHFTLIARVSWVPINDVACSLPVSPSLLPSPPPLPPSCPPSPSSPPTLLLHVHSPLDHYLHFSHDILQLVLSFCSFTRLRCCLRPTASSPHSSSGDFTYIIQGLAVWPCIEVQTDRRTITSFIRKENHA